MKTLKMWFPDGGILTRSMISQLLGGYSSRFYFISLTPEPSSLDNVITLPKSRASNVLSIHANSEGSVVSAYLRRLT